MIVAYLQTAKAENQKRHVILVNLCVFILVPILTAFGAELIRYNFHVEKYSVTFIVPILVAAVYCGELAAYICAVITFILYNVYFLDPIFVFSLSSADSVASLFEFFIVAALIGRLAGRIRDTSERNLIQARNSKLLFEATRALSVLDDENAIRGKLISDLQAMVGGPVWIIEVGRAWSSTGDPSPPKALVDLTRDAELGANVRESARGAKWQIIKTGFDQASSRVVAWEAKTPDHLSTENQKLAAVMVEVGHLTLQRAHQTRVQAELEVVAQTEKLRSTLLAAISHDIRTPLAVIISSATSIIEYIDNFTKETTLDILNTIIEKSVSLNNFVTNTLSMTRLEAGALSIATESFDAQEILHRAATLAEGHGAVVWREFATQPVFMLGDPVLVEQVVRNVVENALKHAGPHPALTFRCFDQGGVTLVEIEDDGPGVAPHNYELIFEKFFRVAGNDGFGLGLSIVRGLTEAMGGTVKAQNRRDGASGLRIAFTFRGAPQIEG